MTATLWPFSSAQLTAGLRRYFGDSSLIVKGYTETALPRPADSILPSAVRGLRVDYVAGSMAGGQMRGRSFNVNCVVKEPRGTSRAGLASGGRREMGVYRSLASQLPVQTPALIAADASGAWLILEAVEQELTPNQWQAEHYERAVRALCGVHERFWGLADDLAVYTWLARPLTTDYEIYVLAAVGAMEKMMVDNRHPLITGSAEVLNGLGLLLTQVEPMVAKLRQFPATLLHGDFHPGNINLMEDNEVAVYDWQLASVGPGVLDLVAFINACRWERADLPVTPARLFEIYRDEMAVRVGLQLSDAGWSEVLDHALMWCFTQEMLNWAANAVPEEFARREAAFRDIWLLPVLEAARRRLRGVLYFET